MIGIDKQNFIFDTLFIMLVYISLNVFKYLQYIHQYIVYLLCLELFFSNEIALQ